MASRRTLASVIAGLVILTLGLMIFLLLTLRPRGSGGVSTLPLPRMTGPLSAARDTHAPSPAPARERVIPPAADGRILLPEAASLARTLNSPDSTAEADVQTLSQLVTLFRRANDGAIPAGGLNEEITESLLGANLHHFAVLPPDCPGLDSAGRLLDRWGTPYFLHPLSREVLEIRSAGPDRRHGTADDVEVNGEAGENVRR